MPRLSGAPPPAVEARVQVAAGLRAAVLLARGDERGVAHAMLSMEGAARSFWAAAICLPAFVAIRLVGMSALDGRALAAEGVAYALGWALFPLAALPLSEALGRGPLWPSFVAAWNWANLAQYGALLLALVVGSALPAPLSATLGVAALGYALWLEWFVARAALRIGPGPASAFVGLDLALGLAIALTAARVGAGG